VSVRTQLRVYARRSANASTRAHAHPAPNAASVQKSEVDREHGDGIGEQAVDLGAAPQHDEDPL
jgi:hypothetical protein